MTSYDYSAAWKLAGLPAEPPEGERMCECGDDYDEHIEEYPLDRLVSALLGIERMARGGELLNRFNVQSVVDQTLTKCTGQNCICRGFEPREKDMEE